MPPAPLGNDGPARFVAWVEATCEGCGHDCAWRDQYLRRHCAVCEPAPVQAAAQNLEARWERWGQAEALPAPGRPVQLRLF